MHDIQNSGRDTRLKGQSRPDCRRRWCVFSRLQHDRVPPSQCRRNFPRTHHEREVPRRNRNNNTRRTVSGICVVARIHGISVRHAHERVISKEANIPRTARSVMQRLRDGFAHVPRVRHGKFMRVLIHQIGKRVQYFVPFIKPHAWPWTVVKSISSSRDGLVRISSTAKCDIGPLLLGVRVNVGHGLAVH